MESVSFEISNEYERKRVVKMITNLNEWKTWRDELIPPEDLLSLIGGGNFIEIGDILYDQLTHLIPINSKSTILDVGCGIGRLAIPLTKTMDPVDGKYYGIDIMSRAITWCEEKITSQYPNFTFIFSDVINKFYNPNGKFIASEYVFPFPDNFFGTIILTSVFTHMLPLDFENYLKQIARVIKKDGQIFSTFFLLNDESNKNIDLKKPQLTFSHEHKGIRIQDLSNPEFAVGYSEKSIKDIFLKNGFEIVEPIHYGFWSGRQDDFTFQDIIVAKKR